MRGRATHASATLLTALVLTACATPPTSPGPTAPPQPSRPRDISMIGLDPCAVLTDAQIAQLGVKFVTKRDSPPSPTTGNVGACVWQSGGYEPSNGFYVQGVTYRSFADVRADSTYPEQEFELRGYRAVTRNRTSGTTGACEVFVDVADGQMFQVAYDHELDHEPVDTCQRAKQAADFGMTYLLTR